MLFVSILCYAVNNSLKEWLMTLLKRWKHSIKEDRMHQYLVRVSYCIHFCSLVQYPSKCVNAQSWAKNYQWKWL